MIYYFRAITNELDDFVLDIAIDSNALFLDLHLFIQSMLDYDDQQMTSFFITDDEWHKEQEITLIDMMEEQSASLVMDQIKLEDLITDVKQRMLYAFDLFVERVLFMELTHVEQGSLKQPVCTRKTGSPPPQLLEDNFSFDNDISEDPFLADDELDDYFEQDDFDGDYPDEEIDPDSYY
jgi:hypothetical protein